MVPYCMEMLQLEPYRIMRANPTIQGTLHDKAAQRPWP